MDVNKEIEMSKKLFFRLSALLLTFILLFSWTLLTVIAFTCVRATPVFSASFNSNLTSSWGSFFNNGPFANGCSNSSSISITQNTDCAYFYNPACFSISDNSYYAYRRLSSPTTTYNHIGGSNGATLECSLKLERLPSFNLNYNISNPKIGQTGFVINVRMYDYDDEFYFCINRDGNNTIRVTSYGGNRLTIDERTPEMITGIPYNPAYFTKFCFVYNRNASGNKIQLYVNGIHRGSFSEPSHRGSGGLQQNFAYFSLVARPLFSSYDGYVFDADSRVWMDYVNIYDKPMPQPTSFANVPLYGQEDSNTCSAASVRMVLANLGIYVSEAYVWDKAGQMAGNTYACGALNDILTENGRAEFSLNASSISQSTFNAIVEENLLFDYPVIVFVSVKGTDCQTYFGYTLNTPTGGHVVVISGTKTENNTTYYEIHDPYSGGAYNTYNGQVFWIPENVLYQAFCNHSYSMISYMS